MSGAFDDFFGEVQHVIHDFLQSFFSEKPSSIALPHTFTVLDTDYSRYVEFVGTAHFSERSLSEAVEAVKVIKPVAITLELCPYRYEFLQDICKNCPRWGECTQRCEFLATVDELRKVDVDVWLIDMIQDEIAARVLATASREEAKAWKRLQGYLARREEYGLELWEEGLKDEAMRLFDGDLKLMKETFPTLWRVLILERNALMACRLIFIVSQYVEKSLEDFKVVVLTGAAHVKGLRELLTRPREAFQLLNHFGIAFSQPPLIKRTGGE
ncbi:MAG: hypothetical protein ACE5Z5_05640 [Candidatus Bathyarchaeia archaeon]